MRASDAVGLAVEVADEGLAAGEFPIGAVVLDGDEVIGRSYTQERALGRRIVHADLLALIEADSARGFRSSRGPLVLAVTLEPCLMCMGAAVVMGVQEVHFALASPDDGAAELISTWTPPPGGIVRPPAVVTGGHREHEVREQFSRYATNTDAPESMRAWARTLAAPPS